MILVFNNGPHDHAAALEQTFSGADEILISTAYFKSTGLNVVRRELVEAITRGARIRLFCGLDFWLTDPAALLATLGLFESTADAKLFVCRLPTNFHPKLYCSISGRSMSILVGSANLSHGGLKGNVEISAIETMALESPLSIAVRRYFDRLEKATGVDRATRPLIHLYERECAIHRKRAREAEQKAKADIAELNAAQPAVLRLWLGRYLRNVKQETELKERVKNYSMARTILDRLAGERIESEQAFADLYGRLVGAADHQPLWASGGLCRARASVVKQFAKALAMLRAIKTNLRRSPAEVFEIGISHAQGIKGLGPNVVTEAMTTWNPGKYPVLNRNPVTSIDRLGFHLFPAPAHFQGATYAAFTRLLGDLKGQCGFDSFVQLNHFLNYVYWRTKKSGPSKG